MDFIRVVKALLAFCILAVIFGADSFFVLGYRVPLSLNGTSLGAALFRKRNPPDDSRIVGGKPAVHGEFPYQASLQKVSLFGIKTHFCGGAVASSNCIVTAAHCLEGRNENDIAIRIGSTTLRPDTSAREFGARKLNIHPEYNPNTIQHDIGVIKLKTPIAFRVNMNKVPLPVFKSDIEPQTECLISGWGSTREGGTTSRTLMYATVPIMSDDKCKEYYGRNEIYETMICAGYRQGGIDSCQGDSGGPLVCNGELTGIVSWGVGCARPSFPGVYTQVSYYTKWIESLGCFDDRSHESERPSSNSNSFFNFPFFWPSRDKPAEPILRSNSTSANL